MSMGRNGNDERGAAAAPAPAFDPAAAGWTIRDDEPGLITVVGPMWQFGSGDGIRLGFVARPDHANRRGVLHGGMTMTFADQVLGVVAIEATPGKQLATVQLDTHFVDAVGTGEFVEGHARIVRRTRSMLFMSGVIHVGDRVVATANGIWKVLGA